MKILNFTQYSVLESKSTDMIKQNEVVKLQFTSNDYTCVATCKNGSAMLFVGAKVSQFALLPQGRVEAKRRVLNMVKQMDEEGFGNCSNTGACEIECPKGISLENIARMNREYVTANLSTANS